MIMSLDSHLQFLWSDGSWGKNTIIFGADMSSSMHVDNKKKDILVFDEGPTQILHDTTMTVEAKYPINFTAPGKILMLSLNYNGSNSFLFANTVKMYQFKAKDSETKPHPLHLGKVSKDFTRNSMKKKTGLNGSEKVFQLSIILIILAIC